MNDLLLFDFDTAKVRIITTEDGQTLFVGADVCTALGYTNPNKAMTDHCKGVTKRYPLPTPGGDQMARVIGEPDLFRLIIGSKLPAAERFERWVFEEVLPSIRRTGQYRTTPQRARIGGPGMTISPHRVHCYASLKLANGWLTNDDLARRAKVSKRCARSYTKLFTEQDIVERLPVFPSHQFRWRPDADTRNPPVVTALEQSAGVFGICLRKRALAVV